MSEAIAFDSHRFVKRLTECGFSERQAETLTEEHFALLNSNLATKTDNLEIKAKLLEFETNLEAKLSEFETNLEAKLSEFEANLETRISEFETKIEALCQETKFEIERMKSDLLKWIFGALIAQGGLIVALVKLL